jgi:hypothetical protein
MRPTSSKTSVNTSRVKFPITATTTLPTSNHCHTPRDRGTIKPQSYFEKTSRVRNPTTPLTVRPPSSKHAETDPSRSPTTRTNGSGLVASTYLHQKSHVVSAAKVHSQMKFVIFNDLTKGDAVGSIYLIQSPNKKALVKIGYTGNYKRRKREIEGTCDIVLETIEIWHKIPNMKRSERLVKEDLSHLRKHWKCRSPTCSTNHGEWHGIGEATAIGVVTRWIDWMQPRPHGEETS